MKREYRSCVRGKDRSSKELNSLGIGDWMKISSERCCLSLVRRLVAWMMAKIMWKMMTWRKSRRTHQKVLTSVLGTLSLRRVSRHKIEISERLLWKSICMQISIYIRICISQNESFCHPRDTCQCLENILIVTAGGGGYSWNLMGRGQGCFHLTIHRTASQ